MKPLSEVAEVAQDLEESQQHLLSGPVMQEAQQEGVPVEESKADPPTLLISSADAGPVDDERDEPAAPAVLGDSED